MKFLTVEELKKLAKKNPRKLIGKLIETKDGTIGRIVAIDKKGFKIAPISILFILNEIQKELKELNRKIDLLIAKNEKPYYIGWFNVSKILF